MATIDSSTGNDSPHNFICGVVEGFYGRPWTTEQRKDLFQKMKKWGMNSYVYAPKDDYKHRAYWRELYTVEEAEHLTGLINAAKAQGITFYYALSPGLDITYSNQKEITSLKRKLEQVSQFGCMAFALLFDDIESEMSEADKDVFQSFAHAQVSITNEIQQHLGGAAIRFLLCPTQYCGTRALPSVTTSEYLSTLGSRLSADIDIMWTGPKVISKVLTTACIEEITGVLRRPPVIWDNLHANDYDQKRMFLGPYMGRSPELIPLLRGVLSNPNCEYNANMVPIRTLAHWANCSIDANTNANSIAAEIKLEQEGSEDGDEDTPICINKHVYHHRQALREAVAEWLPEFAIEKIAFGPIAKPQPIVNTAVPIIPIIPSVNTCMSLTTTTATMNNCTTSMASGTIPTVNTSQLQALADICTTISAENFNPIPNPIMNSLVSATKVITNESIPNPIPPLVSSNMALPSEIPVTTISVPIMDLKSFGDIESENSKLALEIITKEYNIESNESEINSTTVEDVKNTAAIETKINANADEETLISNNGHKNNMKDGAQTINEDNNTNVTVDDRDEHKELTNGAMSIEELSPNNNSETAMEYTPEQETAPSTINSENSSQQHQKEMNNIDLGSPNQDIDVVMTDESSENGAMQVESIINHSKNEMVVELHTNSDDNLTVDDLMLLCDLFYLPFEHGSQALKLLQEFNWLKCNAPVLIGLGKNSSQGARKGVVNKSEYQEWHGHAQKFNNLCERVGQLARRLSQCNNRELLHDICGYVWDLRAVVGILHSYVKWLALAKFPPNICHYTQGSYTWFSNGWKEAFMSGDQEPWVFRGGLTADLQRLIPIDNGNDLLAYRPPTSPTSELYTIRPYIESDKDQIRKICHKTCKDGMDCSELFPPDLQTLPADKLVDPYLSLLPEHCMVIEGEPGEVLGYACAAPDIKIFQRRCELEWAPRMRRKYPPKLMNSQSSIDSFVKTYIQSFYQFKYTLPDLVHRFHPAVMQCYILPMCNDHSAPKRLVTALLAALRASGSFGVHVCINTSDHYLNQFYTKLGFAELNQDSANNHTYLGRTF
ncbi:O-GlcNAcase isoform X2 [Arctopsyche grandis]|uniref:O-GlcNAcase isoform X2 n=1 Tax=Arctopsyche grandis TaxID=121162 RepID=UPI00406D8EE7